MRLLQQAIKDLEHRLSELSLKLQDMTEVLKELQALEAEIEAQLQHHEKYLLTLIQEIKGQEQLESGDILVFRLPHGVGTF